MRDATRSTSTPHRNPGTPHTVDNTDWLKTAAIILVAVDHFGYFFMDDDRWWSVFGRPAAPTFFFLMGYAQTRTVPLHWIWLGIILTLRKLERQLDLGGTEHPFELRTHPLCTSLCANPCATTRLGGIRPPRFSTYRGVADSGDDCRLRRGGMVMGPVWLIPTHICRQQISYRGQRGPKLDTTCTRDGGERASNALAGLLCRRGCLRLAGTKGILPSSDPIRRLHSRRRRFVRWP